MIVDELPSHIHGLLDAHLYHRVTVQVPGQWVTFYRWWLDARPWLAPNQNPASFSKLKPIYGLWFLCFRTIPPEHILHVTPASQPAPTLASSSP
jgi:hypothetical protein